MIRSSWGTNPYIKGAYSHRVLKFDDVPDPVEKLQRPIFDSSGKVMSDASFSFQTMESNMDQCGIDWSTLKAVTSKFPCRVLT